MLGSSLISPRVVLGGIGLVAGASALLMTWIDHSWTFYQITAVAVLYNISALSWHGILLAEIARVSPPEQVGGITGGVLSFTSIAMMIYPAIFGLILAGTDSYKIGFALAAIPSFVACAIYLAPPIERPWRYAALDLTRRWVTVKSITSAAIIIGVGVFLGVVLHDAP